MAVPKGKVSRQRRNSRRANWKLSLPGFVKCPQCHDLNAPRVRRCAITKARNN